MNAVTKPIEINNGTLIAKVIPFGASLTDLRLASSDIPLVLGYEDPAAYENDGQFLGAVIGRYANRIASGQGSIGGKKVQLEKNENGVNHLHGGASGFYKRHWDVKDVQSDMVVFSLTSEDGEAGYPGTLQLTATYDLRDKDTLRLSFEAECDQDTLINICHHPYFNFAGGGSTMDHELWINTARYLPSDDTLVPTGEIADVEKSSFDFQTKRRLDQKDYNNTYCLHDNQTGKLQHSATLTGGGVKMELWTTQPGLHLYNGYKLSKDTPGHSGKPYPAYSGICLEAQAWPNSPNQPDFPNTVLQVGTKYCQTTEYRFLCSD